MKDLKRFNQSIKVNVEVDAVSQQLYKAFCEDTPNKENITEAIITKAIDDHSLGTLYSALNNWEPSVDYEVGDIVTYEEKFNNDTHKAEIIDVRKFSNNPYLVRYKRNKYDQETWTNAKNLSPVKEDETEPIQLDDDDQV